MGKKIVLFHFSQNVGEEKVEYWMECIEFKEEIENKFVAIFDMLTYELHAHISTTGIIHFKEVHLIPTKVWH